MKKKQVLFIFGILVILIGLVLCLLLLFFGLYGNSRITGSVQESLPTVGDPVTYLKDSWQFQDSLWDRDSNTVTAIRTFDISYEDCQKVGAQVFTGDLAPDTYLTQALTIAADLNSRFSMDDVTVVISYRSNDDREIFSVDSVGNVSTCWDSKSTQDP